MEQKKRRAACSLSLAGRKKLKSTEMRCDAMDFTINLTVQGSRLTAVGRAMWW